MSKTVTKELEETDIDSFIDVENKIKDQSNESFCGFVKLKSAEIKKSDKINTSEVLDFNKYIVFSCLKSEDIVIMPVDQDSDRYKFTLEWTESDKIGSLANERIPVKKIDSGIYTPLSENGFSKKVDTYNLRQLIKDNYVYYDDKENKWVKKDSYSLLISTGMITLFSFSILFNSMLLIPLHSLFSSTFEYLFLASMMFIISSIVFAYLFDNYKTFGNRFYNIINKITKKILKFKQFTKYKS